MNLFNIIQGHHINQRQILTIEMLQKDHESTLNWLTRNKPTLQRGQLVYETCTLMYVAQVQNITHEQCMQGTPELDALRTIGNTLLNRLRGKLITPKHHGTIIRAVTELNGGEF